MTAEGAAHPIWVAVALALGGATCTAQPNPVQPELPFTSDTTQPVSGPGLQLGAGSSAGLPQARRARPQQVGLFGVEEGLPPAAPAPMPELRFAQFQLPQSGPRDGAASGPARERVQELAKDLDYQYSWGSDTELIVERNNDLRNTGKGDATRPSRDNLRLLNPTVFFLGRTGVLPWADLNIGATFEQQLRLHEESTTVLPDGTREPSLRRAFTAKLDVANIVINNIPDHPLEITLGRRTFEDPRLWLYDVTLDGVHVRYRGENYSTEASVTREDNYDLSVFLDTPKSTHQELHPVPRLSRHRRPPHRRLRDRAARQLAAKRGPVPVVRPARLWPAVGRIQLLVGVQPGARPRRSSGASTDARHSV